MAAKCKIFVAINTSLPWHVYTQEHLLAYWSNFVVALQCPPNGNYIATVVQAYHKFNQG